MITGTSNQPLWYVARERFRPHLWHSAVAQFTVERGHLLEVRANSPLSQESPAHAWAPEHFFIGENESVETFGTFRNQGGFSPYAWGPFSHASLAKGIWYIRGTFGSGREDLSILRAGLTRRFEIDDLLKQRILVPDLFSALMGDSCITIENGKIELVPLVSPTEFLRP